MSLVWGNKLTLSFNRKKNTVAHNFTMYYLTKVLIVLYILQVRD